MAAPKEEKKEEKKVEDDALSRIEKAGEKAAKAVTKAANDATAKMTTLLTDLFKKQTDASEVAQADKLTIAESGKGKPIEVTSEQVGREVAEIEAFMAEKIMICVHEDTVDGALEIIVVTVNGKNQAIIRGKNQLIKRKYVEALANSRLTTYKQETPDSSKPDAIQMVPKTALTYPFAVVEDKHKYGAAWLQALLNQR